VTGTGMNVAGTANVSSNANIGGNINVTGTVVSAGGSGGNLTGANVISANTGTFAANISAGNANVTSNANVGGNLNLTGAIVSSGGTGGNISGANVISANTGIFAANISAVGATFTGNANITGVTVMSSNANVGGNINVTGTVVSAGGSGGNLTGANVISANTGTFAANITASSASLTSNANVGGNLNLSGAIVSAGGTGGNISGANVITANTFIAGSTSSNATGSLASVNTFGFKNRIINGAMRIAQRATSATITAGSTIAAGYSTVDRFYAYCTGASVTAAQVAGTTPILNNLQITGAASVTAVGVGQRIESQNSADLAGSICTLSVNLSNSLLTTVTWTAYYANTADTFGTLAAPTVTQIATGSWTVTSTLANYNAQISVPSAATTGLQIVLTVGAQTSGTWIIGNVQLEPGNQATPFDYRDIGRELILCQRYYEKAVNQSQVPGTPSASNNNYNLRRVAPTNVTMGGTVYVPGQNYMVVKRAQPTITLYSDDGSGSVSGSWTGYQSNGTSATIAPTINNIGDTSFAMYSTTATYVFWQGYYTASAEL